MSRRFQLLFSGLFLATIFIVPLSQAGLEIYQGQLPEFFDVFTRVPKRVNLRTFETNIENRSVYATAVRPWVQSLLFMALRDPGEKALLGRDGWLFYTPDVRYLVENKPAESDTEPENPVLAITTFSRQLSQRGIHLIVLPMPGKPSVYPDELTHRAHMHDHDFVSPTRELISSLQTAGVETMDLYETFLSLRQQHRLDAVEPYYLAQDTHWSGTAVRIIAHVVARRLLDLGWAQTGSTEYTVNSMYLRRRGDIIRMASVPSLTQTFPAEEVHCFQVFDKETRNLYKDDARSAILLLGDSFFRMYETDEPTSAGFIAHLARELRTPLTSIVNDGGASTLVRQQLSRRSDLLRGKKLVIWEFVERDIRFGTDGWKYVPLPRD